MGLLDDLREAAATIDPQFLPTQNELQGVVAGLALHLEHGEKFLEAAGSGGTQAVTDLLAPALEPMTAEESDAAAAEAARHATAHQTTVEHEPGAPEKPAKGKGKG